MYWQSEETETLGLHWAVCVEDMESAAVDHRYKQR